MEFKWSIFGENLCEGSGIGEIMTDLGLAIAKGGDDVKMLGGGQPAHIPEMDAIWRERMKDIMSDGDALERTLGNYDSPAGNEKFREALAGLFEREFGWKITKDNIAITAGGQTAFFFLFNALAGEFQDGGRKKILLPILPEYIGYANQAVGEDFFEALPPKIERTGPHRFKYRIDFEKLDPGDDIAAICVSRPTNPSGNVLTDGEIKKLRAVAQEKGIPLIIDNAYGAPFPNVIFSDVRSVWDEEMILTLSLSKIGLPGTRTGIVVGSEQLISAMASMTGIVGLSNNNMGQALMKPLIESGEVLKLSEEVLRPFYQKKSDQAAAWVTEYFDDEIPYSLHEREGALFLWLWFEDLPISTQELYGRLKKRNVFVVPGEYFFFGLPEDMDWQHSRECIRVTYTMAEDEVRDGIRIIADEVAKAYAE